MGLVLSNRTFEKSNLGTFPELYVLYDFPSSTNASSPKCFLILLLTLGGMGSNKLSVNCSATILSPIV